MHWHSDATFNDALTDETYLSMVKEMFQKEKEGGGKESCHVDLDDDYCLDDYEDDKDCEDFTTDNTDDHLLQVPFKDKSNEEPHQNDEEESLSAKMEKATLNEGEGSVCE